MAVVFPRRFRTVLSAALCGGMLTVPVLRSEEIKYREASVRAMWIKLTPEPVGGSSPFSVRVSENKAGDAAVGLIEHILGGAGDSWKSSAWIAAVAASNTKYTLLTDHEFLIKVRGFLDGPSAGMLMAATMIALMGQDEIRPHVTITGTINPDGTIGPVSGIPEKLEGAKRAGIKELGYPMFDDGDPKAFVERMDKLGAEYGIKAVPVADIYDAYKLLTGRTLGRTPGLRVEPLKPEDLAFTKEQAERFQSAAAELLSESRARLAAVKAAQAKVTKPSASVRKSFEEDIQRTEDFIAESEKHAKEGHAMIAHSRAVMADQSSRMAEIFALWQAPLLKNDDKTLVAIYDAQFAAAEKQLAAYTASLRDAGTAPTLAGRIHGFHGLLQSWVVRSLLLAAGSGKSILEEKKFALQEASSRKASQTELKRMSDDIADTMLDTSLKLAILQGRVRALMDTVKFPFQDNNTPAPDLAALTRRLAESYGPAAAAGLAYFESTVIGLRSRGSSDEALIRQGAILAKDINYASCAEAAVRAVRSGDDGEEELPGAVLDRLACGAHAWLGMASLMNKYYNLAEDRQSTDPVTHAASVTLRKGQAVTRMLDSSRRRVLEEAAIVNKEYGFVPDSIKMNFNLAESRREDPGDQAKLDALTSYWRAHFICRMAHLMARVK